MEESKQVQPIKPVGPPPEWMDMQGREEIKSRLDGVLPGSTDIIEKLITAGRTGQGLSLTAEEVAMLDFMFSWQSNMLLRLNAAIWEQNRPEGSDNAHV